MIFAVGTPVAALLVLATSLLGGKSGLVPRWLAWLGLPITALMIVAFLAVIPFLAFLAWVLVVSALMIWKPGGSVASAATATG